MKQPKWQWEYHCSLVTKRRHHEHHQIWVSLQCYGTEKLRGKMQSLWKLSQRLCHGNVDERRLRKCQSQQLEKR
jgi:hypothetical protein